ncbi:MAG: PIN domain-containing protein [Candidatus Woesearchaeota archaeon]
MEVVLDANVLFRVLISRGDIIKLLFDAKLVIFAPAKLKEEFRNNKREILAKSKLSEAEFNELSSRIFDLINFVPLDIYKQFIPQAKELLRGHDKDCDFIALCLMKGAKLWTYEERLFNIGFGISTKEVSKGLSKL